MLYMGEKWHLYLANEARISLCGIPIEKCAYVAKAIKDTLAIS